MCRSTCLLILFGTYRYSCTAVQLYNCTFCVFIVVTRYSSTVTRSQRPQRGHSCTKYSVCCAFWPLINSTNLRRLYRSSIILLVLMHFLCNYGHCCTTGMVYLVVVPVTIILGTVHVYWGASGLPTIGTVHQQ